MSEKELEVEIRVRALDPDKDPMNLAIYRMALSTLCKQQATGELFVRLQTEPHPTNRAMNRASASGTLLYRIEVDGIRFRWVDDTNAGKA